MKTKLFYGLCGCSSDGTLFTPSGKKFIKLPKKIAFKIHTFLNKTFAYTNLEGTKLLEIKKERKI